jgi:predicted DNA-binding WGR domain protein
MAPKFRPKAKAKGTVKGRGGLPKSVGKVIPASNLGDKGKLFKPYDVDLNISDAAKNMDKFYRMQVVESNDKAKYWFVQHWGRNGTSGQMQVKGPTDQAKAVKMMEAKFRQKTGKSWADRGSAAAGTANSAARSGKGHYELTARLKKAGAKFATKKGAVAISLMWDHTSAAVRNDLDLWVTAPSGEKIGFKNKKGRCGGELDVDRMQGADKPVENIVWTKNAPKGNYTVRVNNYSASHSKAIPFKVGIVLDGGEMELIEKSMPGKVKAWVGVKKFKYS